jgi:hypothetical protein
MEEIEYGIGGYPENILEKVKLSNKHFSIITILIYRLRQILQYPTIIIKHNKFIL